VDQVIPWRRASRFLEQLDRLLDLVGGKGLLAYPAAERLFAFDNNPAQGPFLDQPDMP
jgi:hypothetical protein